MYVTFYRLADYMAPLIDVGVPYEVVGPNKLPMNSVGKRNFYVLMSTGLLMGPWMHVENNTPEWEWVLSDSPFPVAPTEEDVRALI